MLLLCAYEDDDEYEVEIFGIDKFKCFITLRHALTMRSYLCAINCRHVCDSTFTVILSDLNRNKKGSFV